MRRACPTGGRGAPRVLANSKSSVRNRLLLALALTWAVLGTACSKRPEEDAPPLPVSPAPAAESLAVARGRDAFVGSASCAECHQSQSALYLSSHHARALVKPEGELKKTRFD